MKITSKIESTKIIRIQLSGRDIIKLLKNANKIDKNVTSYEVLFDVPTGGDYSGIRLSVDDYPLIVSTKSYDKIRRMK